MYQNVLLYIFLKTGGDTTKNTIILAVLHLILSKMFMNYDPWDDGPKEVIEMEDIEIDDNKSSRPVFQPPQQTTNFTPATFRIEPRSKNHLNKNPD